MENKKTSMAFVFLAIALLSTGMVFAYKGDSTEVGPNYSDGRHELMLEVFETSNYDLWIELMDENSGKGRVLEMVNEGNFKTFVEAHNAMVSGDTELAQELRVSLNFGQQEKNGEGYKSQKGSMGGQQKGSQRMNGDCLYAN